MIKLALIAHDGKKPHLVSFALQHINMLKQANICATGTTGGHLESAGIPIERLLSGPQGGDAQIAARVAEGELDAVFFFRDPLEKHPHEPDVQMLMRLCDVHDVPLATNPATANLLLDGFHAGGKFS